MADQKNRGGQKQGNQQPAQSERKQSRHASGNRSERDKRHDRMSNPDDKQRQPTNR